MLFKAFYPVIGIARPISGHFDFRYSIKLYNLPWFNEC